MEGCVVENHHIIWLEFWDEGLFHPFEKEIAITISGEDDGCQQLTFFESGDQIDAFAGGSVSLFLCLTAFTPRCPAIRVDFITVHACFIYPDTLFFGYFCKRIQEGFAFFFVAFAVVGLFFLRVQPRRFNVRLTDIKLTSSSHCSFMCASVECACALANASNFSMS